MNNPNNFKSATETERNNTFTPQKKKEKIGFFEFFRQTFKDIEDYEKYQKTKRINEKKLALSARKINLSDKQKKDAQLLRRNAEMVIDTLDDQLQKLIYTRQ